MRSGVPLARNQKRCGGFSILEILILSAMFIGFGMAMNQLVSRQVRAQRSAQSKALLNAKAFALTSFLKVADPADVLWPSGNPASTSYPPGSPAVPIQLVRLPTTTATFSYKDITSGPAVGTSIVSWPTFNQIPYIGNTTYTGAPVVTTATLGATLGSGASVTNYDYSVTGLHLVNPTLIGYAPPITSGTTTITPNVIAAQLEIIATRAQGLNGQSLGGNTMTATVPITFCTATPTGGAAYDVLVHCTPTAAELSTL